MKTKLLFFDLLACVVSLLVCVLTAKTNETANTIAFISLVFTFFSPVAVVFYKSFKEF